MLNMQNVKDIEITEGDVRTIHDKNNRLIWGAVGYDTKYAGDTYQQTYSGKNLLQLQQLTSDSNGITSTVNADGSITCSGTATSTWANVTSNTNFSFQGGETYTFSISEALTVDIAVVFTGGSATREDVIINTGAKSAKRTLTNNHTVQHLYIYGLTANQSYNFTINNPMLETGSTATPYEPYTGGIPAPNPDYPQDIQVVTGEQTVTVTGKNLWNPSTVTMNKRLGSDGSYVNDNTYMTSDYIKVESSTTYTYSRYTSGGGSAALCTWQADGTFIERITWSGSTNIGKTYFTFTTGANVGLIKICDLKTLTNLQVEQGSATSYEPYQSQDYTVNLGSTELCKIGDYQDYIYQSDGDWYVHKDLGKVVFDGSEGWVTSSTNNFFSLASVSDVKSVPASQIAPMVSNYYAAVTRDALSNATVDYGVGCNYNSSRVYIRNKDITTGTDFKNWLNSHNTTVYYALATPTDTQITDATLIGQLDAVHEWLTRYGYSSTVTGNLPLIINQTNL